MTIQNTKVVLTDRSLTLRRRTGQGNPATRDLQLHGAVRLRHRGTCQAQRFCRPLCRIRPISHCQEEGVRSRSKGRLIYLLGHILNGVKSSAQDS